MSNPLSGCPNSDPQDVKESGSELGKDEISAKQGSYLGRTIKRTTRVLEKLYGVLVIGLCIVFFTLLPIQCNEAQLKLAQLQKEVKANPGSEIVWVGKGNNRHPEIGYAQPRGSRNMVWKPKNSRPKTGNDKLDKLNELMEAGSANLGLGNDKLARLQEEVAAIPGSYVVWVGEGSNQYPVIIYPRSDQPRSTAPSTRPIIRPQMPPIRNGAQLPESIAPPSGSSQTSAKKQVVWKIDSDLYLDIQHIAKKTYYFSLINKDETLTKDDPLTTTRLLFLLRPVINTPSGTTLEATVIAYDPVGSQSSEDDDADALWKKGFEGQKLHIELTPGFQQLKLSQTDRMIQHLQASIFGNEITNVLQKDLAELEEIALTLLQVHLLEALIPEPIQSPQGTNTWLRSQTYTEKPFNLTTKLKREYSLHGHHNLSDAENEVISWKGTTNSSLPKSQNKGIKEYKDRDNGLDEGTVLWSYALSRPTQINSLQHYEADALLDYDGKDIKAVIKGIDSYFIRFSATNPLGKR